ncbi:MAG: hypothetical protein FWC68_01665, partial [Oscillospiraceae bacterium]|nr:hypothetical protein [Oscillospiraceae bacterium]
MKKGIISITIFVTILLISSLVYATNNSFTFELLEHPPETVINVDIRRTEQGLFTHRTLAFTAFDDFFLNESTRHIGAFVTFTPIEQNRTGGLVYEIDGFLNPLYLEWVSDTQVNMSRGTALLFQTTQLGGYNVVLTLRDLNTDELLYTMNLRVNAIDSLASD